MENIVLKQRFTLRGIEKRLTREAVILIEIYIDEMYAFFKLWNEISNRIILCLYRHVGDQRNWQNLLPLSTISLWGNQVANQAINKKEILEIFSILFVGAERGELIFN